MSGETTGKSYVQPILNILGVDRPHAEGVTVHYNVKTLLTISTDCTLFDLVINGDDDREEVNERVTELMARLGIEDVNTYELFIYCEADDALRYTVTQFADKDRVRF